MHERYIVTTKSGQPVIRTDSEREANRYRHTLQGHVIDREAVAQGELVEA